MRLVYCIDSLVPSGGTERVLTTKLNWWACRPDVDVYVVSLREDGKPFFSLDSRIKREILDISPSDIRAYHKALQDVALRLRPDVMIAVAGMSVEVLPRLKDESKKVLEFHYTRNFLVNFVGCSVLCSKINSHY